MARDNRPKVWTGKRWRLAEKRWRCAGCGDTFGGTIWTSIKGTGYHIEDPPHVGRRLCLWCRNAKDEPKAACGEPCGADCADTCG